MNNYQLQIEFYYRNIELPDTNGEAITLSLSPIYGISDPLTFSMAPAQEEETSEYAYQMEEYGGLIAQYRNAVCCYLDEKNVYECEGESLWGVPFLLTDCLHEKYQPGFPLDGLSVELKSGISYYDLTQSRRDEIAIGEGIKSFVAKILAESKRLK